MIYQKLPDHIRDSVVFSPVPPPTDPRANYPGFCPGTTLIPKGYQKAEGYMAFPCDVIFERDVPVILRDGTRIYVDIFRPNTEEKVPVLVNSTMFGKAISYMTLEMIPNRADVPKSWNTGFQTWEGAEPGYWCNKGYAVVNMDIRGVGMSEGNSCYFGSQDAQDNYDVIEHFGQVDWSNGKVALVGNSWLAITQWYAAALNPPHLTCFAPWEGHGNMYEDEYMRGGIPNFSAARVNLSYGMNLMEDLGANMRKFPLMNEYWEDKCADFEKITIPAYVVASYTSSLHTHGTIEGYRRISSEEKWLRIHNTQEWSDFYNPKYSDDLCKFFDHYMKGLENGWEETPKVRICILDPGHEDEIDRPEKDFPLPQQKLIKLYLDANDGTLKEDLPTKEACAVYEGNPKNRISFRKGIGGGMVEEIVDPDEKSIAAFTLQFDEDTEVTGYMKLKLWVEAESAQDMDVYTRICTLDENGEKLYQNAILYEFSGPNGMLRVSHRELDPAKSTICEPYHPHKTLSYLSPGEIVSIEIGIWPTSQLFHKGEQIQVVVAGYDYLGLEGHYRSGEVYNKGKHIIHTGGQYDSHIIIPINPER